MKPVLVSGSPENIFLYISLTCTFVNLNSFFFGSWRSSGLCLLKTYPEPLPMALGHIMASEIADYPVLRAGSPVGEMMVFNSPSQQQDYLVLLDRHHHFLELTNVVWMFVAPPNSYLKILTPIDVSIRKWGCWAVPRSCRQSPYEWD